MILGQSSQEYFQGYDKEINGKRFGYHSPLPDVNTSLLLRGRSDYESLEWLTETVPENYSEDYISFIWAFGMDVNSNPASFQLIVNNIHQLSFTNSKSSEKGEKVFYGKEGVELMLNVTMLDKYQDQMGFAILKLHVY